MSANLKQQQPRQSSHLSSPSSSTPLMASQQQQPPPPRLPSSSSSPSPSSDAYNDGDGSYTLPAATPLRVLAALLSLIGVLMQLSAGPDEVFGVVIHVVSWFAFGWNAAAATSMRTPQVTFVAGGRETVILGGGGGGKKGRSGSGVLVVDGALALALLAVELLLFLLPFHVSYWWRSKRNCYGIVGLHSAVMVLVFIIALLGLFSRRSPAHFVVRPAVYGNRIQLP
ncbi:hypothetical protein F5X96DRAFT_674879 [Biscogniauxia mediterranea]|nr:hypothetical protein F5X96DRAFT_674879 [Biscogniauxia mediterranea]